MSRLLAIFVILSGLYALSVGERISAAEQSGDWLRLRTTDAKQTSQLEAGYPMGCQLTVMVYALKFGPVEPEL